MLQRSASWRSRGLVRPYGCSVVTRNARRDYRYITRRRKFTLHIHLIHWKVESLNINSALMNRTSLPAIHEMLPVLPPPVMNCKFGRSRYDPLLPFRSLPPSVPDPPTNPTKKHHSSDDMVDSNDDCQVGDPLPSLPPCRGTRPVRRSHMRSPELSFPKHIETSRPRQKRRRETLSCVGACNS